MTMFATEQRYWDSLHKLADVFNHYYDPVDYTAFEKMATHIGPETLPILNDLRTVTKKNLDAPLELDTATYYQIKTANEGLAQSLFKKSVQYNTEQQKNVEAYHYINSKIAGVEKWLKEPV